MSWDNAPGPGEPWGDQSHGGQDDWGGAQHQDDQSWGGEPSDGQNNWGNDSPQGKHQADWGGGSSQGSHRQDTRKSSLSHNRHSRSTTGKYGKDADDGWEPNVEIIDDDDDDDDDELPHFPPGSQHTSHHTSNRGTRLAAGTGFRRLKSNPKLVKDVESSHSFSESASLLSYSTGSQPRGRSSTKRRLNKDILSDTTDGYHEPHHGQHRSTKLAQSSKPQGKPFVGQQHHNRQPPANPDNTDRDKKQSLPTRKGPEFASHPRPFVATGIQRDGYGPPHRVILTPLDPEQMFAPPPQGNQPLRSASSSQFANNIKSPYQRSRITRQKAPRPGSISEYSPREKPTVVIQELFRNNNFSRNLISEINDIKTLKKLRLVNRFFSSKVSQKLFDEAEVLLAPGVFSPRRISALRRISKYIRRFKLVIPSTVDIKDINPLLAVVSDVEGMSLVTQSLMNVEHLHIDALGRHGFVFTIVDTALTTFKRAIQNSPMRPRKLTIHCSPGQVQLLRPDSGAQGPTERRIRHFWDDITELTLCINARTEYKHDWTRSYIEIYKFLYVFSQKISKLSFKWLYGEGLFPLTLTDVPHGLLSRGTYPKLTFPRLRVLKTQGIKSPSTPLEIFLKERAPKLEGVKFTSCQLTEGTWPRVFSAMEGGKVEGKFDERTARRCIVRNRRHQKTRIPDLRAISQQKANNKRKKDKTS